MYLLFVLVLLIAPIARFPGFLHVVAPAKGALAVVALGAWLFHHARRKGSVVVVPWSRPVRQLVALQIAFLAWIGITLLLSTNPSAPGGSVFLAHATVFAFFIPFFTFAVATPEHHRRLLWAFVAAATAVACLAVLQNVVMQFGVLRELAPLIIPKLDRDLFLVDTPAPMPAWGYRSWGSFHHPNLLGAYLALAFPIVVALLLGARGRRTRGLLLVVAIVIAGGLFCSGSRGGWMNVVVGCSVLWLLCAPRISRPLGLGLLSGLSVMALLFRAQLGSYFRIDNVLSNRDIIWGNAWTMISERPIFGWGPGTFSRTYLERFDFPSYIERGTAMREMDSFGRINLLDYWHGHNLFLHEATEMGLPALAMLALFFLIYAKTFVVTRSVTPARDRHALLIAGCTAAVVGNLVHSLLETTINVGDPALGVPFLFVFATGLAAMQAKHRTPA